LDLESLARDPGPRSAALARIVRDEQRHAEILAGILQASELHPGRSGAPAIPGSQSSMQANPRPAFARPPAFLNWLWRTFNLHADLLGLIIPKIIARICFTYGAQHTSNAAHQRMFIAIARDLEAHLGVYIANLREDVARMSEPRRRALRVLGSVLFHLTTFVMFIHHAPALHAHGITCAGFFADATRAFVRALASAGLVAGFRVQLSNKIPTHSHPWP
jgi:hypothetical protein